MCQICENNNNEFINLSDTVEYSGIEISINKQGMLRIRHYNNINDDFTTQDIININFCPECGKKFKH